MECKSVKRNASRWIDGELQSTQKVDFEGHVQSCFSCRKEVESLRALNVLLTAPGKDLQVSTGFEARFWAKVSEKKKESLLASILDNIAFWVPMPDMRQAAAIVLVAFLVGGSGGYFSAMTTEAPVVSQLSGLPEYSVATVYLKAMDERGSA